LATELIPLLKIFRQEQIKIPTLYVMGAQDYMFLPAVEKVVAQHNLSQLQIIPDCGHVVNVERPQKFNHLVIGFLQNL
jgi:pimeloyl-ACP methyl ester carboxylesterase